MAVMPKAMKYLLGFTYSSKFNVLNTLEVWKWECQKWKTTKSENLHTPDSIPCLVSFDRLLWVDGWGLQGCFHGLKRINRWLWNYWWSFHSSEIGMSVSGHSQHQGKKCSTCNYTLLSNVTTKTCSVIIGAVKKGEEVCTSLLQNGNSSGMGFNNQLRVVFVSFQTRKSGSSLQFSTCSLFISMGENWFSLFFKSLREKNLKKGWKEIFHLNSLLCIFVPKVFNHNVSSCRVSLG